MKTTILHALEKKKAWQRERHWTQTVRVHRPAVRLRAQKKEAEQVASHLSCWATSRRCIGYRGSETAETADRILHDWLQIPRVNENENHLGDLYAKSGQTLQGSFSAVSKPNFASKYSLESSRRYLHNALLCTVLESTIENWEEKNLAKTTPKR